MQQQISTACNADSGSTHPKTAVNHWRDEFVSYLALAALLVLAYSPLVFKVVTASPFIQFTNIVPILKPQILPGFSTLEPCSTIVDFALAHRAALDWCSGIVPWWNPYQGVGMPLAADMQSCALFLPFVLLYKFFWGQTVSFAILQFLSGVATYSLCRKLGLSKISSFTAGALFELNGVFVFLRTSILSTTAFFPMLVWAIEDSRQRIICGKRSNWAMISLALAFALYAGFPELVYIDGLFAAAWSLLRLWQLEPRHRLAFCKSLALGLGVSLLVAAPVVVPFVLYLKSAYVGLHSGTVHGGAALHIIPQLFFPYMIGPIWSNLCSTNIPDGWHRVGSFLGATPCLLAALGAAGKRERALRLMLCAWIAMSFAKAFNVAPIANIINLLPLMAITAYARYHYPTVHMAICVLAAMGIDDLSRRLPSMRTMALVAIIGLAGLALSPLLSGGLLQSTLTDAQFHSWPIYSISAGLLLASMVAALMLTARNAQLKVVSISAIIIFEATALFLLPSLCRPRAVKLQLGAVHFLQQHLGLQRYYTLGPIGPNLGACFGIASINSDDLPTPKDWVSYVQDKLLPVEKQKEAFVGISPTQGATAEKVLNQLERHLDDYKWLGVKYIVSYPGLPSFLSSSKHAKLVSSDMVADIYELDNTQNYFSAGPDCRINAASRSELSIDSGTTTALVRRELYFPGWTATVNGVTVPIEKYGGLFQSVSIPPGLSRIRFSYEPPYFGWCLVAAVLGILAMILSGAKQAAALVCTSLRAY